MAAKMNWFDRAISAVSPAAGVARLAARTTLARAEYEGATLGRRANSWKRRVSDPNAELNPRVQQLLIGVAHDLVRNNAWAARAVSAIAEHTVGAGIIFHVMRAGKVDHALTARLRGHLDTAACDAQGRHNLYGLQLQAMRAIAEGGAVLVRRRWRRPADGLPLPFQLQLLEADYINTSHTGTSPGAGYSLSGIEFNPLGQRTGYWLHSTHPGATMLAAGTEKFVPASEIAHCFRADRPEQQHGATWFAPVIVRMKDFNELVDAQVVRYKLASTFAAFVIGTGESEPAATTDSNGNEIEIEANQDYLEPGTITHLSDAESVEFSNPPGVDGYAEMTRVTTHEIAAGLGIPYDLLTGDLSQVSFISGRLGRLNFKRSVETWQWGMFITQFCEPVGNWALEALEAAGENITGATVIWSPPRFEMMDPASEVPAIRDGIRSGLLNLSSELRAAGVDPDTHFAERAADNAALDAAEIILDSDPRKVTQVGNAVQNADQRYQPSPAKD